MDRDDIELKLLAGMPIEINGCGLLYTPTVRDIIEIGEIKYNQYLSVLLFDKSNADVEIPDEISNFEFFFINCVYSTTFKSIALEAFNFIFRMRPELCDADTSLDPFLYFEDGSKIDKSNFEFIQEVVRIGHHVKLQKRDEEYNFANETARKFIEKVKAFRESVKVKKKDDLTLHSMINGMAWKSHSVNLFNIFELTIYQLRYGFLALNNIDDYQFTLHGIYAGTIDTKKIKFDKLQWAKITF
nr:hypothetical protein [Mycobacterium sp. E3298]